MAESKFDTASAAGPPQTVAGLFDLGTARLAEAGLPDPRREAAALLGAALGWERGEVWLRGPERVSAAAASRYNAWIGRRAAREPFAYITGEKEWFGLRLHVRPGVLIPRPETELLAEFVIGQLPPDRPVRVADLCTGSGCLAVAIAKERPQAAVVAVDVSHEALAVARTNAERHGVASRIQFVAADVLADAFWPQLAAAGPLAVIVANPPYVARTEYDQLEPDVRQYEPVQALVPPGGDALAFYRRLVAAAHCLQPAGLLAVEVGAGQAADVAALLAAGDSWSEPQQLKDYSGQDRIVVARRRL